MPLDFIVLKDGSLPALPSTPYHNQAGVAVVIPGDIGIPHPDSHGNPKKIGPAILAYMVDPSDDAKDLIYEVKFHSIWAPQMHGPSIEDYWTPPLSSPRLTGGVRRGYWEVISSQLLRPSVAPWQVPGEDQYHVPWPIHQEHEGNHFEQSFNFTVVSGHGTVTFSDIVLFFRW